MVNQNCVAVVAQLVVRSLPTSEIRGSNPVICNIVLKLYKCIEKTKIKRGREWPLKSEQKFEKMSFDW